MTTEIRRKVGVKLNPVELRRNKPIDSGKKQDEAPISVSQGPVKGVAEYILNPTRDKIREVTVVSEWQGRLLPPLDVFDMMWHYVIEIAAYRQDSVAYKAVFKKDRPIPPNPIDEFTYRTAQWQKSVRGKGLQGGMDLSLAEMESKNQGDEPIGGGGFGED